MSNASASSGHNSAVSLPERRYRVRQKLTVTDCCIISLQEFQLLDMIHYQSRIKYPFQDLVKVLFYQKPPQFPEQRWFVEGSQALSVRPSSNSNL